MIRRHRYHRANQWMWRDNQVSPNSDSFWTQQRIASQRERQVSGKNNICTRLGTSQTSVDRDRGLFGEEIKWSIFCCSEIDYFTEPNMLHLDWRPFTILQVNPLLRQCRISLVSRGKTVSSASRIRLLFSNLCRKKRIPEIETNDSLMAQVPDYVVDVSKLPIRALSIFVWPAETRMVWSCHVGRQHHFHWSILVAFFQLHLSIAWVADNRHPSQSFRRVEVSHSGRFPFCPTKQNVHLLCTSFLVSTQRTFQCPLSVCPEMVRWKFV